MTHPREEEYTSVILTDKLEFHIISLEKFEKIDSKKQKEKELLNWCKFMLSPNEMEAKIMEENKYIKKAKEELEKISQDEAERELAYRREKAIRDQNAVRASGYNEGKEAGKKEIIQKMLDNGLDAEAIVKITGLTQKEINNILK